MLFTTLCLSAVTALGALRRSSALFGLIDDVDCAVVSMEITEDLARPVRLQHVASIPALAYVATGVLGSVECLLPWIVCVLPVIIAAQMHEHAVRLFMTAQTQIAAGCESFPGEVSQRTCVECMLRLSVLLSILSCCFSFHQEIACCSFLPVCKMKRGLIFESQVAW